VTCVYNPLLKDRKSYRIIDLVQVNMIKAEGNANKLL